MKVLTLTVYRNRENAKISGASGRQKTFLTDVVPCPNAGVDNLGPVLVTCLANLLDSPITLFLPHRGRIPPFSLLSFSYSFRDYTLAITLFRLFRPHQSFSSGHNLLFTST